MPEIEVRIGVIKKGFVGVSSIVFLCIDKNEVANKGYQGEGGECG